MRKSVTHFFPRWINRRLQYYGERYRSWRARQEPETTLPFPYNDSCALTEFELNKLSAEPDFEAYWQNEQRLADLEYAYRKMPLLKGLALVPEVNLP